MLLAGVFIKKSDSRRIRKNCCMKRSLLLLLPAAACLLFASCKRNDDGTLNSATPGSYSSLDDVFARTAPLATTQALTVSSGGDVFSKGGTRFTFPRDAFQSYTGALVTGRVDVKVYDWLQKGDMVFARVLPVSNNNPLYSSGQAYVEVTQNGVPVRLRKGYYLTVKFPQFGITATGDSLYLGETVAGSGSVVNWYRRDTAGRTTLTGDTVSLRADSLRYIAASHFMSYSSVASFPVKVNSPVPLEQSLSIAVFDGLKSVFPLSSAVNGVVSVERVPAGMKGNIAVMGINKGVFYAGIVPSATDAGFKTDTTYQVLIKQVDPQIFRLQLNAL